MKRKTFISILFVLVSGLGWLTFVRSAYSTPNTIPVTDANAVFEPALAGRANFPATLRTLIDALPDRLFFVHGPNGVFWTTLEIYPSVLADLINTLPDAYFPVRSGNAVFWQTLVHPGATLGTLLEQIPDSYIPVRSANGIFAAEPFQYPSALIADNRPPIIGNVQIEPITGLVEWDTDEFATTEVHFGTEPGVYTEVISDTVWQKHHQVIPASGGWNYILLRAVDRSGNLAEYYYPGHTISGMVQDDAGVPIEGTAIWVESTTTMRNGALSNNFALITLTDANGNYSLAGIPDGEYNIYAYHPDFAFDTQGFVLNVQQDIPSINFEGKTIENKTYLPLITK